MRKKIFLFLPVLLILISESCSSLIKKQENIHLRIYETTDVHGAVFPFDFIDSVKTSYSLSNIYSIIKKEREKEDQEIILLDNGDILQGQPLVYYSNYIDTTNKHICSEVMNFMGYDAATIGNHDIEAGHAVYDKLNKEFDFPWLAANAIDIKSNKPYFEPYTIIKRKGYKIAVLGLITPAIPQWLPEKLWKGMRFEDMVETAKYWVPKIRKKEDPDILIGLFHAGHDYTYGGNMASTKNNENASLLVAKNVPGFDIIMLGHDHRALNEFIVNSNGDTVLLLNAGSNARYLAVADVKLWLDEESGKYKKKISGELVDVSSLDPDKDFNNTFRESFKSVMDYVTQPVGYLENSISAKDAFFGNSAFVDLAHDIQLDLAEADISFTAPLSFNATIPKGIIRVRDMFRLYRFENFLYTMNLTGEEIRDYMEYSYANWFNTMNDKNDHLLKFRLDSTGSPLWNNRYNSYELEGKYYNFDSGAGLNYTVDISKTEGNRITINYVNDEAEFDPDKNYTIAINSYRGNGGGGHLTKGAGIGENELKNRIINSTVKDLRFFMMEWIKQKDTIAPEAGTNWNIIPVEWHNKGAERDYKLLFEQNTEK